MIRSLLRLIVALTALVGAPGARASVGVGADSLPVRTLTSPALQSFT
jgi:hypothetical protein